MSIVIESVTGLPVRRDVVHRTGCLWRRWTAVLTRVACPKEQCLLLRQACVSQSPTVCCSTGKKGGGIFALHPPGPFRHSASSSPVATSLWDTGTGTNWKLGLVGRKFDSTGIKNEQRLVIAQRGTNGTNMEDGANQFEDLLP